MSYEILQEYGDGIEAEKYIEVPRWVDRNIDIATIGAIIQGGCASGAYMSAVTYNQALNTMNAYGDEVIEYIEDQLGELPNMGIDSWSMLATKVLSLAVEIWAQSVEDELVEALEESHELV